MARQVLQGECSWHSGDRRLDDMHKAGYPSCRVTLGKGFRRVVVAPAPNDSYSSLKRQLKPPVERALARLLAPPAGLLCRLGAPPSTASALQVPLALPPPSRPFRERPVGACSCGPPSSFATPSAYGPRTAVGHPRLGRSTPGSATTCAAPSPPTHSGPPSLSLAVSPAASPFRPANAAACRSRELSRATLCSIRR